MDDQANPQRHMRIIRNDYFRIDAGSVSGQNRLPIVCARHGGDLDQDMGRLMHDFSRSVVE